MITNDVIVAVRVTFPSGDETLVGTLYRPATFKQPLPGIVVAGSWTTVKEQMAALYARRLAQRGFAALAFDYRGWGESGGEPRSFESPRMKIEDYRRAIENMRRIDGVDPERIGALAICASTGYLAHAVAEGAPARSIALVASWLHDQESVKPFYGGDEGVTNRIQKGHRAEERWRSAHEVEYVPAYDPTNPDAAMFFELEYYANETRGRVASWDNRFAVMSWPGWLEFDALSAAPRIAVPTLMVHADDAALPENARRFFAALAGPKDLYWTQGTQTDFYDQAPHVERAVQLAAEHFMRTLDVASVPDAAGLAADRAAIADRIASFLLDIDRQNWTAIRAALRDTVFTDYTSLFGGTAQTQSADALVDTWRSLLPGFDATQHMLGPIVATITTDGAEAHCAVTGTHRIGDEYWTIGGSYEIRLVPHDAGWNISAITLRTAFVQGDPALPARASARAAG